MLVSTELEQLRWRLYNKHRESLKVSWQLKRGWQRKALPSHACMELVSAHMTANLVHNVREAIEGFPVGRVIGWLDSTVALRWICSGEVYKQFVRDRVHKIREEKWIEWRHVRTQENPVDLASRGGDVAELCTLMARS